MIDLVGGGAVDIGNFAHGFSFFAHLGPRARRFCDATGYLFAAVFFAVWTWQMGDMTAKSWSIREMATGLLPFPLYPVKFVLFTGLLWERLR